MHFAGLLVGLNFRKILINQCDSYGFISGTVFVLALLEKRASGNETFATDELMTENSLLQTI